MASFSNRFFAIRKASLALVREIAQLQAVCLEDRTSKKDILREMAVLAVRHLDYALERARAATVIPAPSLQIWVENQGRVDHDAYERFLEAIEHDSFQYEIHGERICNAMFTAAELAASHARDAINEARSRYSDELLVLRA